MMTGTAQLPHRYYGILEPLPETVWMQMTWRRQEDRLGLHMDLLYRPLRISGYRSPPMRRSGTGARTLAVAGGSGWVSVGSRACAIEPVSYRSGCEMDDEATEIPQEWRQLRLKRARVKWSFLKATSSPWLVISSSRTTALDEGATRANRRNIDKSFLYEPCLHPEYLDLRAGDRLVLYHGSSAFPPPRWRGVKLQRLFGSVSGY